MPRYHHNAGRVRFSLTFFLLVLVVIGLVISNLKLYVELRASQRELSRIRAESNAIYLRDEEKIHVSSVRLFTGSWAWQWNLFLPDGHKYDLFVRSAGEPGTESAEFTSIDGGYVTIMMAVGPDHIDNNRQLLRTITLVKGGDMEIKRQFLSSEEVGWWKNSENVQKLYRSRLITPDQRSFEIDETVVLIGWHGSQFQNGNGERQFSEISEGPVLYLKAAVSAQ